MESTLLDTQHSLSVHSRTPNEFTKAAGRVIGALGKPAGGRRSSGGQPQAALACGVILDSQIQITRRIRGFNSLHCIFFIIIIIYGNLSLIP